MEEEEVMEAMVDKEETAEISTFILHMMPESIKAFTIPEMMEAEVVIPAMAAGAGPAAGADMEIHQAHQGIVVLVVHLPSVGPAEEGTGKYLLNTAMNLLETLRIIT